MSSTSIVGTGHINGGPGWPCQLITEVELIDVSTALPKPDPKWTFTDGAGHFHAHNERGNGRERYPTLRERVEKLPCDNADHDHECEGLHITHRHCLICDEEIQPGVIPGPHYDFLNGREYWEAKIQVPDDQFAALSKADNPVSLRLVGGEREAFGIATVSGSYTFTSGDPYVTLTLYAAGPLGWRKTTGGQS